MKTPIAVNLLLIYWNRFLLKSHHQYGTDFICSELVTWYDRKHCLGNFYAVSIEGGFDLFYATANVFQVRSFKNNAGVKFQIWNRKSKRTPLNDMTNSCYESALINKSWLDSQIKEVNI